MYINRIVSFSKVDNIVEYKDTVYIYIWAYMNSEYTPREFNFTAGNRKLDDLLIFVRDRQILSQRRGGHFAGYDWRIIDHLSVCTLHCSFVFVQKCFFERFVNTVRWVNKDENNGGEISSWLPVGYIIRPVAQNNL